MLSSNLEMDKLVKASKAEEVKINEGQSSYDEELSFLLKIKKANMEICQQKIEKYSYEANSHPLKKEFDFKEDESSLKMLIGRKRSLRCEGEINFTETNSLNIYKSKLKESLKKKIREAKLTN
jgi:hypothetical protein